MKVLIKILLEIIHWNIQRLTGVETYNLKALKALAALDSLDDLGALEALHSHEDFGCLEAHINEKLLISC